jgi:putative PIN family toxin of toxin-antitoxin system
MKVFFDTNVYVAEALIGRGASRMIEATLRAKWRIYASPYLVAEFGRVMIRLGFAGRLTTLSQARIRRHSRMVNPAASRHTVARDPADTPILRAALRCSADYLVTNDRHLLDLNPYEDLQIITMDDYLHMLDDRGLT